MATTAEAAAGVRALPVDFAERVYAGVLGKIIGVYLGRPFEGWTYERIARELGDISYYVHDKFKRPLVVPDDDISGTFTFVRAFEDFDFSPDLTPRQIGQTWTNYLVDQRTILWWGGMGNSTEHTAYIRLQSGFAAPASGSIATNGKVVAEQIGAQIFIDSWAMLCPGDPERAADYARRAGSVSHDGEAVYGAQVIAAMEALAFIEPNLQKLTAEALRLIPADSVISSVIRDVQAWRSEEADWRRTRARIEERYGYHRYGGNCHIVPNHALIHLGLQYGGDDFGKALLITNSSGWDTDCNSGNVGCLLGIKSGLAAFEGERDWRGPVADRLFISSADGSRSITDAVRESQRLVYIAQRLHGGTPAPIDTLPRFNFAFPGSLQGWRFMTPPGGDTAMRPAGMTLTNVAGASAGARELAIRFSELGPGQRARLGSDTFIPPEDLAVPGYQLCAWPALVGGQTVRWRLRAEADMRTSLHVQLYVRRYGEGPLANPVQRIILGPRVVLSPGVAEETTWTLPEGDGAPIFEIGFEMRSDKKQSGTIFVESVTWDGDAHVKWQLPSAGWEASRKAWIHNLYEFGSRDAAMYSLVTNTGRGLAIQGNHHWADYRVTATIAPHLASAVGMVARAQGQDRYYALMVTAEGQRKLIKRCSTGSGGASAHEVVLDAEKHAWDLDRRYRFELIVRGSRLHAYVDGIDFCDMIDTELPLMNGAIGLLVSDGRADVYELAIEPLKPGH